MSDLIEAWKAYKAHMPCNDDVNAVDSQGDQEPHHEEPCSTMPIVDDRGDIWIPIIIRDELFG